jgi:hypothetical protein
VQASRVKTYHESCYHESCYHTAVSLRAVQPHKHVFAGDASHASITNNVQSSFTINALLG